MEQRILDSAYSSNYLEYASSAGMNVGKEIAAFAYGEFAITKEKKGNGSEKKD